MGKHRVRRADESLITAREVWEDFVPDRRLSEATVERLKVTAYMVVSGVLTAVALTAWPFLKDGLSSGHVDVPGLWEAVRVAAAASLSTWLARVGVSRARR